MGPYRQAAEPKPTTAPRVVQISDTLRIVKVTPTQWVVERRYRDALGQVAWLSDRIITERDGITWALLEKF